MLGKRGTMKAFNIEWAIDDAQILEVFDDMSTEDAAEALKIPCRKYSRMTISDRHKLILSHFRHCPGDLYDFFELPEEVDIPEELEGADESDVTEWLSDEWGYFVLSYSLATDIEEV